MRTKILVLLAAAVVGATTLILVSGASAGNAPGVLDCPTLNPYNPTHYALQVGTTVTCTIDGATDVADGPVNVFIKSTPLGNTTVVGTAVNHVITFTFTAPANGCETSVVAYGSLGNNAGGLGGFGYVDAQGNHIDQCTGTVPPAANLTATKTANASFDRKFTWGITKDVDKTTIDESSGSATFNYVVKVTHDGGTDSNWSVSGAITVNNPNNGDVTGVTVTDAIADPHATCAVTDGTNATIPGNSAVDFSYTCTYTQAPSSTSELNTGTVSWGAQSVDGAPLAAGTATGTATANWSSAANIIDGSVTVTDSLYGPLGTVSYTDPSPKEFDYSLTFTDPGGTCTKHDNTATFTSTTSTTHGSASQSVTHCVGADLTVSKTAAASFNRSYTWHIHKAVDKTSVENNSGSATFNYTVTVNHDAAVDSGWQVTGTITVTNPNDWESVTFDLADAIDNGGVCTITGGGSGLTLAASATQTYDYTCTYASAPNPASGTNTATATWDKATYFTPGGTASGTALFDFGAVTPTTIDECVSVSDPIDPNSPHAFCVGDTGDPTFSFTYSTTLTAPAGQCSILDNTATFTTNDTKKTGSDSKTVQYCNFNAPLTIGYWKTHIRVCGAHEKTGTGGCNNNGPFTVAYLPQHLGSFLVPGNDSGATALAVFNANNCGASTSQGAVACLAAQLLAAKLNVANGANTCINATIASADAFLILVGYTGPTGTYTLTAAQRATAISLKTKLDTYNNGGGC